MNFALLLLIAFWIAVLCAGANGNARSLTFACIAAGLAFVFALIDGLRA